MDRLNPCAAFAAVLLSFGLAGCGQTSSAAADTAPGSGTTTTITGVSTPSAVSVVTAKNAN